MSQSTATATNSSTSGLSPDTAAARARIKFDAIDLAILDQLQNDSNITNATLAQRVGISPPSTLERVKKLVAGGVIKGYRALLDPKAVNKTIQAFVHVTLRVHGAEHIRAFDEAVAAFDEIQGAWHTTGEEDFMLRVLVTDMDQYERFIVHRLSAIPNIGRVRTSFILSPVKDETRVPLDAIGGGSVDVS
ncbi:MAG: Lrp/AsnC family transcriptional regulator [Phycisphaerales bacterium]